MKPTSRPSLSQTAQRLLAGLRRDEAMTFFDPISARTEQAQLKGRMTEYMAVAAFVIMLAALEWLRSWLKVPYGPGAMSVFALCVVGYCGVRLLMLRPRLRAVTQGQQTWRMMEMDFASLGEKGYLLFDALNDADGNELAPVLIGPGGVFTLMIRSTPASGQLGEKLEHVDRRTLIMGGRPALGNPLGQARLAATTVQTALANALGSAPAIQPVLIYPGWSLARRPSTAERDVWVVNERTLAEEITSASTSLEPAEIIRLSESLDRMRRTDW